MNQKLIGAAVAAAFTLSAAAEAQVPYAASYVNEAWRVLRNWEDKTPEAGIAWPANSGLNWQQKYARWIQAMKKIPRHGDDGFTFEMLTPWGKTLPAPVADCADTAMLLRVLFASWYNLPVVIRAGNNYYGHFGIRVGGPAVTSRPLCSRCDYTGYDTRTKPWPKFPAIRNLGVGSGDTQDPIGGGRTGAYLDEVLLNKRVAYVITHLLSNAGSGNLAGSLNLYDIKAPAIQAGDVLIERWQAQGIGHTIVVKHVEPAPNGKIKVEIAAGWLPPRQTLWEGSVNAHGALSDDYFGGSECANPPSCTQTYAHFGGGLKRWRPAKGIGGKWVPSYMAADAQSYIQPNNYAELGKRVDQFEDLVYLPPPEELRDELVRLINEKRESLRNKPSGCAARENREKIFDELYRLMASEFGMSRDKVDAQFRKTEDYVFAPLDYTKSPTCCWNGSTAAMGASVVANAIRLAKQSQSCAPPPVFMKSNNDYPPYRGMATGVQWVPYANDERCGQGSLPSDSIKPWSVTPFCTAKPFVRE